MVPRHSIVLVVVVSLLATSCGDDFELPEPPDDLDRLAERYERPTARIDGDNAAMFIERFLLEREQLAELDDFRVVTDPVDEFVDAVDETAEDDVDLQDSPIDYDALVELSGDCPGWDDTDEPGGFDLRLTARKSSLVPIAWGEVDECRGQRTVDDGDTRRHLLSGNVSMYVAALDDADETDDDTLLVAFDLIRYIVEREPPRSWSGSFRRTADRVEMLYENDVGASVVLFGGLDGQTVGLRAANGEWQCDLEEQECEPDDSSASRFSY